MILGSSTAGFRGDSRDDNGGGGMTRWRFRPPLWAVALTALALALFGSLGAWQLQRGAAKAQLLRDYNAGTAPAIKLTSATPPPRGLAVARASAAGRYARERDLLLDGQSHDGHPGRHVWTPFRLDDGGFFLVDRGWIALEAAAPPPPADIAEVSGFWRALPQPGIRLEGTRNCPDEKQFPLVVQYPTQAEIECLLGAPVLGGLLQLDAAAPGGFVRAWNDFGFPPERHYGYAVQWFGLGLTALVLFVALNLKRVP